MEYQHWQLESDEDNVMWACLDRKDRSANALNHEVMQELADIVKQVARQQSCQGLIITSKKTSGFIAGADVSEFTKIKTETEAIDVIKRGQAIFAQLAALQVPTLALIKGFCLGGGLELALACDYRVAVNDPKTRLGLPEVMLGIHPGWGGTVRLPRLLGPVKAFTLILTGRPVDAKKAYCLGLVDAAVPERQMYRAAKTIIKNKKSPRRATWREKLFNLPGLKELLAKKMRAMLTAKRVSQKHYPAPYAAIDNWLDVNVNTEAAFEREAESIGKLMVTDTARNLLRVFFLQEQLKSFAKDIKSNIKHVHVIGAGTMGGDIAAWCALRGCTVTLQDKEPGMIAGTIKRAHKLFNKKLKQPRLIQAAVDRLIPNISGSGIKRADLIIEAVFEDVNLKQTLFKEIEAQAKPDAILATNTSSIPLDEINTSMQNPKRLVGIHFFNPVAMMQLVEVVSGERTSETVMQRAMAFVKQISRLPLPVKSQPGFVINRILMPYLLECVRLLEEGISSETIDAAAEKFGMPMGPVELADAVGLDICLSVAEKLTTHYGGEIPKQLTEMVKQGRLGRKVGRGFYSYRKGKAVKKTTQQTVTKVNSHDIADRLIMRIINASSACLRDKVIAAADLLDAGMIFGTGFAPFRGGPAHYAASFTDGELQQRFNALEKEYGERFKIDSGMEQLINSDKQGVET